MQENDIIRMKKMIREIDICTEMLGNVTLSDFNENVMQKRAVAMTIIIIGELAFDISYECRMEHTEIPWKTVSFMRHLATPIYHTQAEDVYYTAKSDYPLLKNKLELILSQIKE